MALNGAKMRTQQTRQYGPGQKGVEPTTNGGAEGIVVAGNDQKQFQRFRVSRELCTVVIYCRNQARVLKIVRELLDASNPPAVRCARWSLVSHTWRNTRRDEVERYQCGRSQEAKLAFRAIVSCDHTCVDLNSHHHSKNHLSDQWRKP